MSQKLRKKKHGVMYHVYSRIQNMQKFMKPKKAKELMLQVIKMAQKKYNFELNNYNILHDHFHFLVTPIEGEADISRIMQFIKSQFARKYNKMTGRIGPVWNERFGDVIVEDTKNPKQYFARIMMYIFYNPVKKKYVDDPRDYEFSSMKFYFDETYKSDLKLTFSEHYLRLGSSFKERTKKLLEFEALYLKDPLTDFGLA